MGKYAIVAVGYNRPASMQRLLNSLAGCFYDNDNVTLIISIDNCGTNEVEECANSFSWRFGEKKVITYYERLGLRKHILHCGDFVIDYDAIAVFEDDIVAAPGFYIYMKEAVEKYKNNDQIAGISLYNHLWNVHVEMPFEPAPTPFDTYFLQFAQSWGQVWTKNQWLAFREWYNRNCEEFGEIEGIPLGVCKWPKSSWLKYHIRFCIEQNKYFVYPYKALSTCFSDIGMHCKVSDTHLQVPILTAIQERYRFPDLNDPDCAIYDAYFERRCLSGKLGGIDANDISVNLYGYKGTTEKKRYVLTMKKMPYKIVDSYGLQYRPHELNIFFSAHGNDIFLYDTSDSVNARIKQISDTKMFVKCVIDRFISMLQKR